MSARIIVSTVCALMLVGCAALSDKWTTTVKEDKERGAKPTQYQATINTYLNETLKDPFSAQQKDITTPKESVYTKTSVLQSPTLVNVNGRMLEERQWTWLVTVQVNAKNSYGGYIGWKPYQFHFQGEKLFQVVSPS